MFSDRLRREAPGLLCVEHFGPDPDDTGGMETVLRTFGQLSIGADRVVVHPTRSARSLRRTVFLTVVALWRIVRMPAAHVVHVHLSEKGSFIREGALVLLARARGLTVVVTNHGSKFVQFAQRRPGLVARVLSAADLILCLSQEALSVCGRLAPGTSTALVVNPVQDDPASPVATETGEVLLFAGEVGERKGVDVLLRAWQEVGQSRPDARLVIAGPPVAFEVPPTRGVDFIGAVANGEIRTLMRDARAVVLPSRDEALPVVLAEALAAGRPFVATPVGGIPWLAHGVQTLVPVGDSHALAVALDELLADPNLAAQRGEAGRRFHGDNLSVAAANEVMRTHYQSAVANNRARHDAGLRSQKHVAR